ncbi:MAG: bifunctional riboflavin kinase/FAD synthetase [Bacteroidota bacterium]|nr:bifunctional riboflavin kinase/FAD synthetase [Bacteroidota bacterium]
MKVYRSISEIDFIQNTIVTIGTFDGVHLGHQKIIKELIDRAEKANARTVLVTFDPHPREVVGRGPTKLLTSIEERLQLLAEFKIDEIFIINFTFEFSRLPYEDFFKNIIFEKIGVKEIIVGYDHMFGRDREASIEQLKELGNQLGFTVDMMPPVKVDNEVVSSSKIRDILLRGDVCLAEKYLARSYTVQGSVVKGDGRGRIIGFPTANLRPLSVKKLLPAEGVYFVSIKVDKSDYFGMLNIGVRPTFSNDMRRVIEVHLFDFDEELYGKNVIINFHRRIRSEKKFASTDELIIQLNKDKLCCENFIKELTKK